jgi:hypothetical protein
MSKQQASTGKIMDEIIERMEMEEIGYTQEQKRVKMDSIIERNNKNVQALMQSLLQSLPTQVIEDTVIYMVQRYTMSNNSSEKLHIPEYIKKTLHSKKETNKQE